jgi:hypothetical protein
VKLQKDLREVVELLNSLKVEYVVVGGHKEVSGRDQDVADLKKLLAIAPRKKSKPGSSGV